MSLEGNPPSVETILSDYIAEGDVAMANVVVVGMQWGDEGKGKMVDWLSERANIVVRFQGGHNAGHTLVLGGDVYKLSLLPSAVLRADKIGVIGNGVVLDPWAFLAEVEALRGRGLAIDPGRLKIADNVVLLLPPHRDLDALREGGDDSRGPSPQAIGSTRRGIGPAYEDKVGRRAVHLRDLATPDILMARLHRLLDHHNTLRRGLDLGPIDATDLYERLLSIAPRVLPYMDEVGIWLDRACREGQRILFEGAQGALLDVDHGTYPWVTSSNTIAAQASIGSGIGVNRLPYVLGITKAYTTRVGDGPFPTELHDDVGAGIASRGREVGTVTGRNRRCGWFDAVLVRHAARINGASGLALTKLDVLDGMESIRIATHYRIGDRLYDYFPGCSALQQQLEPVYETWPGWSENTKGARSWMDLPATAIRYVRRIEELTGVNVGMVSTSPERNDMILSRDPFAD